MEEKRGSIWLKQFGESLGFRFVMRQGWAEDKCHVCQQRTGPIWYVAVQPVENYRRFGEIRLRRSHLARIARKHLLDGLAICPNPACQIGHMKKIASHPDVIEVTD
jgi:hypothetical protein